MKYKYLFILPSLHFEDDEEGLELKEKYYNITNESELCEFTINRLLDLESEQNPEQILRLEGIALPLYGFIMGKTWESIIKIEI